MCLTRFVRSYFTVDYNDRGLSLLFLHSNKTRLPGLTSSVFHYLINPYIINTYVDLRASSNCPLLGLRLGDGMLTHLTPINRLLFTIRLVMYLSSSPLGCCCIGVAGIYPPSRSLGSDGQHLAERAMYLSLTISRPYPRQGCRGRCLVRADTEGWMRWEIIHPRFLYWSGACHGVRPCCMGELTTKVVNKMLRECKAWSSG